MSDEAGKVANVTNVSPIPVDPVYASAVAIQGNNQEFSILFSRNRPAIAEVDGKPEHVAIAEPVSVVILSVFTLKDLSEILNDTIKRYEAEFGEIHTAFTRNKGEAKGRG